MKLNGVSNVITDVDITLTSNKHIGESLQTVLEDTDNRIDKLESNIKWIYQNGGVGSGSGGGGSTTKWYIRATLNSIALESNQEIPLSNGAGNYQLRLYTTGGSGTYSVTYTYGGASKKVVLNADNGWSVTTTLTLTENGILEIIATDGSITREITGVTYIVIPYVFNAPELYTRDGTPYSSASGDIFVETAQQNGIIIKASYVIATESRFWYTWYFNGVAQNEPIEILDSTGILEYEIDDSLFIDDNAGLYSYQLVITVLVPGSTEPYDIVQSGSFNLIPDSLYLKISTANSEDVIYDDPSVLDPYVFSTNTSVALNTRIYNGLTASGLPGTISWVVNGDPSYAGNGSINVTDGVTYTISTYFANSGWNYVTFNYTLGTTSGEAIIKYFYCQEINTSYDWFFKVHGSENTPDIRRYYIAQALETENKLYGITGVDPSTLYIEKKKSNDNPTILNIISTVDNKTYVSGDQMFNFGIQYNEINDVSLPLIICYDSINNEAIKIYQDKVIFGGQFSSSELSCNVFLHKEDSYDVSDRTKYHLLTINCATCYYADNNSHYELSVYLDGKLEGTVSTKPFSSATITRVALQEVNFGLNHFELSSWGSISSRRVFDTDINWYYNSYASRLGKVISDEETLILTSLFNTTNLITTPDYGIENQLVKVDPGLASTVAANTTVPILALTCPRDIYYSGATHTIYEWMNSPWRDGQEDLNKATFNVTKVEWSPGGESSILTEIEQPKDFSNNVLGEYILDLQGSSTMTYKSKNFTFGIRSSEYVTLQNKQTMFSPNFNSDDNSTFLPETSFTLKADVVDSSHSNNTAVGKFVNENNDWDYLSMINLSGVDQKIRDHIKQCLEGFATLLFLNVTWKDESQIDHVDSYYLGIYNFNLGRGSYFNLGYSDLTQLDPDNLDTSAQSNHGFAFCVANTTPVRGFVATEVQDNSRFWDFSQYDKSILFPLPNSGETSGYMFGDFVYAPNTENVENSVQSFVKSVAGGGGFLFDTVGKRKVDADTLVDSKQQAYHKYDSEIDPITGKTKIYTYVNDYTTQYLRSRDGSTMIYSPYEGDLVNLTPSYLEDCIVGDIAEGKNPKLNYESVVYYYVTCMVLGLVDSVQKNLNIKTWNASDPYPTMATFFYDMDTCLGKSNSGAKTSYFAFSDYWKSNIDRYDAFGNLIPDWDTTTPVARTVNKGITNFRDTFLWGSNVTGYDTPSSYLFAIAKYGYLLDFVRSAFPNIFPQNIYAEWRQVTGVLSSADNFINNYFASNLDGIPACLINLNYRNKYLYDYQEQAAFAMANILHGTGVEETRDWLKGRLRIMDAYFNVIGASIQINDIYYEPIPTYTVSTNPDVNLYKDIFTNDSTTYVSRKESMSFNITAPDYSPLVVRYGNDYIWYIFEDSNTEYETYVPISGVQITVFGGSQIWRTLDSINSFVQSRDSTSSNFIFNTDTLTTMVGNSGTQTGTWDVLGPSLETISLTSSNYGGTLNINGTFYSIKNINISNSRISLVINESCPVKNVTATNLKNASNFTLSNCKELETVSLNNSIIGNCTITPAWTDQLNFSSVYATTLVLEAKNSGNLTINNNSVINSLSFRKMQDINITNCSALTTITCTDSDDDNPILKNVIVTNCPSLRSITLKADNLEVLNLTNCTSLQEITLRGSSFNNLRVLGLANTKVSKITIGNDVYNNGIFNFTRLPKLAKADPNYSGTPYVSFYNNKQVVSIQFENTGDTILRSDPNSGNGPFRDCSNLERLYGSFLIESTYCFYNSKKFSVHGSDLQTVTWNGQVVLSGTRCRHPYEWGVTSSTQYWPRQTGITNMRFNGNYASGAFYYTNYTIFDAYYMLYGCDDRVKSLASTFRSTTNTTWGRFYWNASVDNSPNVHMFDNCGGVENMTLTFWGNSGTIRWLSPSYSGNNVILDNGLFSPLTSLKYWDRAFSGYTVYADRFVLRRTSGSYKIQQLDGFYVAYILEDINSYTYSTIPSYNINDYGNLTQFFKNLPNLSGDVKGLFDRTAIIDFSTIASSTSKIPDGVTILRACFTSTYGTGTISLSSYFSTTTNLQKIYQSFIVNNVFADEYYPTMLLSNTTFERFVPRSGYPGLVEIGYSSENTNFTTAGPLGSSFSGAVYKYFGASFPFNIFRNLTNLRMAAGVFMNAHGSVEDLKLPGNLFERNTQLINCAAEFYNLDNKYTLTETYEITYDCSGITPVAQISTTTGSPNFVYCPNLTNVSYLFGEPTSNGDNMPHLSGMIPRNLFWHGLNLDRTKRNVVTGTDIRIEVIDPETQEPTGEYTYGEPQTVYQYVISPNATISGMDCCFQHCNCSAYVEENLPYEPNPEYSPFLYLTDDAGETFYDNPKRDTKSLTSAWFYDGRSNYTTIYNNTNVVLLDTVDWDARYSGSNITYEAKTSDWLESGDEYADTKPQAQETYICAPDLLRYCASNVTITNLFAYSGVVGMNTYYHVSTELWSIGGKYAFGILGRICPYLLKPVSNTTSVAGMFASCKRLSYIANNESNNEYLLPSEFFTYAKNVTNLQNMFKWTVQPHKVDMVDCFIPLNRNNLDIQYMFANCYWQGTSSNPTTINNVFVNNNIDTLTGVFEMEGASIQNAYPKAQYITFNNIFNSKYSSNTYAANVKFSYAFYGWTEGYVTHESSKTLPNNGDTNNYTYVNN